ncbi:hypothetical protein SSP24_74590 [Streptomyces spinoverrucosus]|uniref:Uncharacterized protein n=1 Tax=Streptomyces spinoverrucosus TaxID=284043 RepID=A0A4Y3VS69_9ACTN|nr:hypothetical protein SSP24_74590 [Streptomyces spinoverrucosus]GHB96867.1 hypothetical protein GCM10010397_81780 [Streptomyces spinoverrucosus]
MVVGVGELGERGVEHGDVVIGGVGRGVAGPQQVGQGLAGVVEEAQQRVVAEAVFVGRCRVLLLRVAGDRVASMSRTRPGGSRPPAREAGIASRLSSACSQATSRAAARAARRAPSAAGSMPASSRHAVGLDAAGPNTSVWSRSRARSAIASPPSAGITAKSTAIRPGA